MSAGCCGKVIDGAAPSKVEHLTLYALADKLPVIEELCRPGREDPARHFVVRGYLPGGTRTARPGTTA